jgi:hypothetical protein
MVEDLIFRIGAIGIRLSGESDWEYTLVGRFLDFLSSEVPQVSVNVKTGLIPVEPTGPPFFDSGQSWRIYQNRSGWVLWVRSPDRKPYLVGGFSPDFHTCNIFTSESDQVPGKFIFPLSYPVGELLMTNVLGTGYGVMLHSCGVVDAGDGIVFAGVSSAGKTTTAHLWESQAGVRVLNDDHTILRKIDGQFRVYGTPWHGQGGMALAEDAPLKQIFILKHDAFNHAERLSPVQAAAALLVRAFPALWSAPAIDFTLQFLDELCQAVPCYELGFVPDESAVEYVRCLSAG